jgi:hypothetical protein
MTHSPDDLVQRKLCHCWWSRFCIDWWRKDSFDYIWSSTTGDRHEFNELKPKLKI